MTISDDIRALARNGVKVADISRKLGIRYQHAYNVLKGSSPQASSARPDAQGGSGQGLSKPPLTVKTLLEGGFVLSSRWQLSSAGELIVETPIPKLIGVYAFVKSGFAKYVGVATMGLAKRLYFYGKPGITQRTSQRLNGMLKKELLTAAAIDIYTAMPPDLDWNGLPIHGSAGLELGLIKKYALPWNMRSSS